MSNFIQHISISNFKSINKCEIKDCKRINLFIGRPNVGKSNILEALSLFSIPYLKENPSKKLSNLVRLENETELFYKGNIQKEAVIQTNIAECILKFNPREGLSVLLNIYHDFVDAIQIDIDLNIKRSRKHEPPIKKYVFKQNVTYKRAHAKYLIPPYGFNLLSIIEHYPELKKEVLSFFKEYGLDIVFDKASQTMKIIHKHEDGIFLIPYNSIADTLQRIIFYKTAIASNNNSILLFEEPEAHSFPPYMSHLTQEMIYKKDNQYFLTTHSPFILNDLLENAMPEVAVFIINYTDRETKVHSLNEQELHEIYQNGVDVFTNSESFV